MKRIHIGHPFYGAGNVGDDLMLAGFLSQAPNSAEVLFTCCVPFDQEPLRRRFPRVEWLAYDAPNRTAAVAACDAWLGLGGSPFQMSGSAWFADHLEGEVQACGKFEKPMYYLGIGGQDQSAYSHPALRRAVERATHIWTRDPLTAERAEAAGGAGRVSAAADLAHAFLEKHAPPAAASDRLTVTLNLDFREWPPLTAVLDELRRLPTRERVWFCQEARTLPGTELDLFGRMAESTREFWTLRRSPASEPTSSAILQQWPTGAWLFSGRYHSCLVGAWAGSRGLVLATNEKLAAAAAEFGWPLLHWQCDARTVPARLAESQRTPPGVLARQAQMAREACAALFREL